MKTLRSILVFIVIVGLFGGALWYGLRGAGYKSGAGEDKGGSEAKAAEPELKMDAETQKRLALVVEPLKAATLKSELPSFGRVMDPTPLMTLDDDLAAAETALEASTAAQARSKSLFQGGENVARKQVETAEAQYRTDQAKAQGLRRKLELDWGGSVSQLDTAERGKLISRLARSESAFVRVDVAAGDTLPELPKAARVIAIGRESQPIAADAISPATSVDPKTQAQGFLLRVDHPVFPLRPGAAVTAFLELPGEAQEGVVIPRAAIVYFAGTAWAYVQEGAEKFERRKVSIDKPVGDGVFVTEDFKPDEKIVTAGAQALLSSEQKTAGGDAD